MQVSMIKIGNSRGVRLPKHVIDAAGLKDDLALEVRDGAVIVRNARTLRSGWAAAAADCHASAEDDLGDWDGAVGDGDWS